MSKRTRTQSAKNQKTSTAPAAPTPITAVETKIPPSEQLRLAIEELKKSTALLLGTAISEVQQGAAVLLNELKSRATLWFSALKQPQRVTRTNSVASEQSSNPVLS